jgi:5-methylcytosine-specific restriction endonuclease McrA
MVNAEKEKEYQAAYRLKNATYLKEYFRAHYQKNKARKLQETREYKNAHRDYYKNYLRQYFLDHKAEHLERSRKWHQAHPEQKRARTANRRAKVTSEVITKQDIAYCHRKQKGKCYWCSKEYPRRKYHVDHVWPLAKGGANIRANIVIACIPCNLRKGTKTPAEFAGRLI